MGLQLENAESKKFQGAWRLEMGGIDESEGKDEGAAAYFRARSRLEYHLAPWLRLYGVPRIQFYSSRIQQRFDDDPYQNGIYAEDAYASLEPVKWAQLHVGAIGQKFLDDPILISQRRAFPGAQFSIATPTDAVRLVGVAQYLIPTSYSLNAEREDKEPLPSFQTQSVHLEYKVLDFKGSGMVGHYMWTQLPDKVAFESAIVGNTVPNAEVAPGARFAYGFNGIFWGEDFCWCSSRSIQFELDYMGEHNSAAPGDSADAQLIKIGPRFVMGDRELEIFYYNYFIESDATVAVYGRESMGYTNRIGDAIEAKYILKDKGFNIQGRWNNARTLQDKDTQKTLTGFYLGVETDYAPF
jgi:hypothetical protein